MAYWIDDAETLRRFGAVDGLIVYAFSEVDARGRISRVGSWRAALHPDDLLEALETMRASQDPFAPRPKHRTLQQLIDERLTPRELRLVIDIDDLNC